MFDTVAEASQKLSQTIILKGGSPIRVADVTGSDGFNKVKLITVNYADQSGQASQIYCNSPDLDFGRELGSRCGYANITHKNFGMALFTSRIPIRKSHSTQGLSNSNMSVSQVKQYSKYGISPHRYNFSSLEYVGMRDTLLGKFPSLAQVRYKMGKSESILEMAFDKNLAVSQDSKDLWKLMYKNQEIGWTDDLTVFRVPSEWRYLDETFDQLDMKIRS